MEPYKPNLTFKQFLTCIAQGSTDIHWLPQLRLCNVCEIGFDYIGHLETVDTDAAAVIARIGINATFPHSFASNKHYKTKMVMKKFYKWIPADLLRTLIVKYKYDFELHGYDKHPPGRSDMLY